MFLLSESVSDTTLIMEKLSFQKKVFNINNAMDDKILESKAQQIRRFDK